MSHHPSPLALQYSKAIGAFNGSDVWSAWCFVKKFLMLAPLRRLSLDPPSGSRSWWFSAIMRPQIISVAAPSVIS